VLAIGIPETVYTNPVFVNEQPQVEQRLEENEEQSSFAEIFAGLLNAQPEDSPDDLSVEKSTEGNKLNLLNNAVENNINFDTEFSNLVTENEYQLFNNENAEHLINTSFKMEVPQELDFDVQADLSSVGKVTENISDVQIQNAASFAKEALNETTGKKTLAADNLSTETSLNAKTEKVQTHELRSNQELAHKSKSEVSLRQSENNHHSSLKDQTNNHETLRENSLAETRTDVRIDVRNRTPEAAAGRTRRDRIAIEVRDLRTETLSQKASVETAVNRMPGSAQEITLDLRLPNFGHSSQAQTSWEVKAGTAMENMLARELHQNFNGDIVRHASIALRDGGNGTIKINLHPEHLGHVKIRLEMTENKITGHIFVESQEALNAFRKEIASLEQAFKDSGFADVSLDLSFTADGAGAEHRELEESSFMQQMAASNYEDSYESETAPIVDVFFGRTTGSINILV